MSETQSTGLILKPELLREIARCDDICREARGLIREAEKQGNAMTLAMVTGNSIVQLEGAITPAMMETIKHLAGSPLGFGVITDDAGKPKQFPDDVLKRAFIGAVLQGANPTGDEWMVFSGGKPYLHKQVWQRRCEERGAENINVRNVRPEMKGDIALVKVMIDYRLDGKPRQFVMGITNEGDERIGVRVNRGMGEAAIVGKAQRQALKRLYEKLSGITTEDDDPDVTTCEQQPIDVPFERSEDLPPTLQPDAQDAPKAGAGIDPRIRGFVAAIQKATDGKGISGPVKACEKHFSSDSPEMKAVHDAAFKREQELGLL